MYTTKVSAKGWVVIPKSLREKYGLRKGSQVQVIDYGQVIVLVPLPGDPVEVRARLHVAEWPYVLWVCGASPDYYIKRVSAVSQPLFLPAVYTGR